MAQRLRRRPAPRAAAAVSRTPARLGALRRLTVLLSWVPSPYGARSMLIDRARLHARGDFAVHVHHVVLACADEPETPAARILRDSGWRSSPMDPADGEAPLRLSPELILVLAWVNGLRTAAGAGFDVNVAFLLGCVLGPTSSAHRW